MATTFSLRLASDSRGQPGAALDLTVRYHAGRSYLPIVTLKRAA